MATQYKPENDSPGVKLIPPIIFYLSLIVGIVLEYQLGSDFPVHWSVRLAAGLVLGGVSVWFMMWGYGLFRKHGTSERTCKPSTCLVMQGAFQYSRNPMYVGLTGFLLSVGLVVGSVWMMAAGLLFPLYIAVYVVPREEAYMERRWGAEYLAYCNRVRRWL